MVRLQKDLLLKYDYKSIPRALISLSGVFLVSHAGSPRVNITARMSPKILTRYEYQLQNLCCHVTITSQHQRDKNSASTMCSRKDPEKAIFVLVVPLSTPPCHFYRDFQQPIPPEDTSSMGSNISMYVWSSVESISRTVTCTGELSALTCVIPRREGFHTPPCLDYNTRYYCTP